MKTTLTLTASISVIARIVELIQEEGLGDTLTDTTPAPASAPTPTLPPVSAAMPVAPTHTLTDTSGLPWDERIHAGSKTTKADGTWTRRRGVDDATYKSVEAELRAQAGLGNPQPQPVAIPQPAATSPVPVAAPAAPVATAIGATVAAPVPSSVPTAPAVAPTLPEPVAPQPAPAVAPVVSGPPTNLHELMTALTPLTQSGTVTAEYLSGIIAEVNTAWVTHLGGKTLNGLGDIAAFPQFPIAGYIWQLFQRDGKVA